MFVVQKDGLNYAASNPTMGTPVRKIDVRVIGVSHDGAGMELTKDVGCEWEVRGFGRWEWDGVVQIEDDIGDVPSVDLVTRVARQSQDQPHHRFLIITATNKFTYVAKLLESISELKGVDVSTVREYITVLPLTPQITPVQIYNLLNTTSQSQIAMYPLHTPLPPRLTFGPNIHPTLTFAPRWLLATWFSVGEWICVGVWEETGEGFQWKIIENKTNNGNEAWNVIEEWCRSGRWKVAIFNVPVETERGRIRAGVVEWCCVRVVSGGGGMRVWNEDGIDEGGTKIVHFLTLVYPLSPEHPPLPTAWIVDQKGVMGVGIVCSSEGGKKKEGLVVEVARVVKQVGLVWGEEIVGGVERVRRGVEKAVFGSIE